MPALALMNAWASTLPWEPCHTPGHRHTPMAGQPCAVGDCHASLNVHEECYYVLEVPPGPGGAEQAVCWRHVRPHGGPIVVPAG